MPGQAVPRSGREPLTSVRHVVAVSAVYLLAEIATPAWGETPPDRILVRGLRPKSVLARLVQRAAVRLGTPACSGVLDEFRDAAGRPLRDSLAATGRTPSEHLLSLVWIDANAAFAPSCGPSWMLATTQVGGSSVRLCSDPLSRLTYADSRRAEAVVIHEVLHTLGLGERPPASALITERVLARCW